MKTVNSYHARPHVPCLLLKLLLLAIEVVGGGAEAFSCSKPLTALLYLASLYASVSFACFEVA